MFKKYFVWKEEEDGMEGGGGKMVSNDALTLAGVSKTKFSKPAGGPS